MSSSPSTDTATFVREELADIVLWLCSRALLEIELNVESWGNIPHFYTFLFSLMVICAEVLSAVQSELEIRGDKICGWSPSKLREDA